MPVNYHQPLTAPTVDHFVDQTHLYSRSPHLSRKARKPVKGMTSEYRLVAINRLDGRYRTRTCDPLGVNEVL